MSPFDEQGRAGHRRGLGHRRGHCRTVRAPKAPTSSGSTSAGDGTDVLRGDVSDPASVRGVRRRGDRPARRHRHRGQRRRHRAVLPRRDDDARRLAAAPGGEPDRAVPGQPGALPTLLERKGCIVNVASIAGLQGPGVHGGVLRVQGRPGAADQVDGPRARGEGRAGQRGLPEQRDDAAGRTGWPRRCRATSTPNLMGRLMALMRRVGDAGRDRRGDRLPLLARGAQHHRDDAAHRRRHPELIGAARPVSGRLGRDGPSSPGRTTTAAGRAAGADALRQARPAAVHLAPRLRPGVRAGAAPCRGADGLLGRASPRTRRSATSAPPRPGWPARPSTSRSGWPARSTSTQLRAALDTALPDGLDIVEAVVAGPGSLAERMEASAVAHRAARRRPKRSCGDAVEAVPGPRRSAASSG